jgi:isocitrate/isopropylmalate dehydrogenase
VATILSVALLFEHAGVEEAARVVEEAVDASLAAGVRTPDVGGTATTSETGIWISERVAGG